MHVFMTFRSELQRIVSEPWYTLFKKVRILENSKRVFDFVTNEQLLRVSKKEFPEFGNHKNATTNFVKCSSAKPTKGFRAAKKVWLDNDQNQCSANSILNFDKSSNSPFNSIVKW